MSRKRTLGIKQLPSGKFKASTLVDGDMKSQTFETAGEAVHWVAYWDGLGGKSSGFGSSLRKVLEIKSERSKAGPKRQVEDAAIEKKLIRFFGPDAQVSVLDQCAIDAYVIERASGGAGRVIYSELGHLRSAIRHAGGNPNWRTPTHLIPVKEPDLYMPTDAEFKVVWDAAGQYLRDTIIVIMFCGLRPMEVPRINQSMVNMDEDTIDIPSEIRKTASANRIPITETLREFVDRTGFFILTNGQACYIRKEKIKLKESGILFKGLRPYRRAMISWAEDAGFTLDQIALVSGHKRQGMTARYSDVVGKLELKRRILEAVEERFNLVIGG